MRREDWMPALPGFGYLTFVFVVVICAVFGPHWLAQLNFPERIDFWVNLGVSIGTLALAGVTAWNVLQTRDVISSEERRHQREYAPLLEMGMRVSTGRDEMWHNYMIRNIGRGIALNVQIFIVASSKIGRYVYDPEGEIDYEENPFAYSDPTIIPQKYVYDWIEPKIEQFISAIAAGVEDRPIDKLFYEKVDVLSREYPICKAVYYDMFGNKYETIYDKSMDRYHWEQPKVLKFRNSLKDD